MTQPTNKPRRMLHYGANTLAAEAAAFFRAQGLEVEHASRGTGVLFLDMSQERATEALAAYRSR